MSGLPSPLQPIMGSWQLPLQVARIPSPSRRGRRGFTLIEIIMALAACAVILVAIYGVFSRAVKLRDSGTARTEEARARTRAVRMIREDLSGGLVSGGKLATELTGSREGEESNFPGYLKFTTTTARDTAETIGGDVQQVEYFIVNDPDAVDRKAGLLVRAANPGLLAQTQETVIPERVLSGVEAMELSFFDGQNWLETWTVTEDEKTLPEAVRVTIRQAATADRALSPTPIEILIPWTTQSAIEPVTTAPAATPEP